MAKVQGTLSQSIGSNHNTVGTGIIYLGYGCTEGFPDVDCSDVTGGDIIAPMLDEGTRPGLELSRKERQKVEDETRKQQRFLRKKAEGKEKRKETQGAIKVAERLEGLVAAGCLHSKAQELLKDEKCDVRIVYRPRCPEHANYMKGQQYAPNNAIFCNFKCLGGRGSGSIHILDDDTHELVAAIRITEVKDLTPESKAKFQHIFSYFTRNKGFQPSVANNHAMVGGGMRAIGWRASMEQGQAFGTYVPHTSVDPSIVMGVLPPKYLYSLISEDTYKKILGTQP